MCIVVMESMRHQSYISRAFRRTRLGRPPDVDFKAWFYLLVANNYNGIIESFSLHSTTWSKEIFLSLPPICILTIRRSSTSFFFQHLHNAIHRESHRRFVEHTDRRLPLLLLAVWRARVANSFVVEQTPQQQQQPTAAIAGSTVGKWWWLCHNN